MSNLLNLPRVPRVLRVAANPSGTDYATGDIHGAYNSVLLAMKHTRFSDVDRLFVAGDLLDRGPDSWRCARFLGHPGVRSLRGNHEDMLLELYADGIPDEAIIRHYAKHNGFGWWLDTPHELRMEILHAIAKLPTIIELETPRGLVGFVHADIPAGMNWSTFVAGVEAEDPAILHTALWGRDRVGANNQDGVEGIGRVFVGHTPQWKGMRRCGNIYYIDTGAIFAEMEMKKEGRLSFVNSICSTGVLSVETPHVKIDIRDVLPPGGPSTPFGNYAKPARG